MPAMQFSIFVSEFIVSDLQSHCLLQTLINSLETCKTRVNFQMKKAHRIVNFADTCMDSNEIRFFFSLCIQFIKKTHCSEKTQIIALGWICGKLIVQGKPKPATLLRCRENPER